MKVDLFEFSFRIEREDDLTASLFLSMNILFMDLMAGLVARPLPGATTVPGERSNAMARLPDSARPTRL